MAPTTWGFQPSLVRLTCLRKRIGQFQGSNTPESVQFFILG